MLVDEQLPDSWSPLMASFKALYAIAPYLLVNMVITVLYTIQVYGLLSSQLALVLYNRTTNEAINAKKYSYIRGTGLTAPSAFHLGWVRNWRQFWGCGPSPDWKSIQFLAGEV